MSTIIDNTADVIDSRDIIARIEELRAQLEADGSLSDEDTAELLTLDALAKQGDDYAADWQYGETLIRDSYFKAYAQELAEEIGAISPSATWPNTCIDWDQAARELRMDYTAVEFGPVTYWVR
jgi:antirestriction protein